MFRPNEVTEWKKTGSVRVPRFLILLSLRHVKRNTQWISRIKVRLTVYIGHCIRSRLSLFHRRERQRRNSSESPHQTPPLTSSLEITKRSPAKILNTSEKSPFKKYITVTERFNSQDSGLTRFHSSRTTISWCRPADCWMERVSRSSRWSQRFYRESSGVLDGSGAFLVWRNHDDKTNQSTTRNVQRNRLLISNIIYLMRI